jgi:hypothetical protein
VEEFDHTNFPYDFIEANCARTLRREDDATRQDETRRERRRGKRSANVTSQTDSRSPNEGSLIIGREVLLVRHIGIEVLNAGAGS